MIDIKQEIYRFAKICVLFYNNYLNELEKYITSKASENIYETASI